MNEQVKNAVKSKLKTGLDGVINDILGDVKLKLNRSVDAFIDSIWPGLVNEFVRQYDSEVKAKEAKNKTEQEQVAKAYQAKQDIESPVIQGQDSTPVATN